jgi:hypothetical protein
MGLYALYANTTGSQNTAFGRSASEGNTTANSNTSIGYNALKQTSTGDSNVAVGADALTDNTTGSRNVAVGKGALEVATTCTDVVCVGVLAGDSLTTGASNTFIGKGAGNTFTTGMGNVAIGTNAGHDNQSGNNNLYIARAAVGPSNAAMWIFGDGNGTCKQGNNSTAWTATSDERIKKNIVDSTNGLAKIDAIQVRNFEYRTEEEITVSGLVGCDAVGLQTGVIAQEIESVLPKAVSESETGLKQVNTDPIFWSMVKAIQELSAKNDALETQNATFAARLTALEGE